MNNHSLQQILGTHVVELEFTRRHPKLGWSDIRGLFGTTNFELLNSEFGFQVLRFMPPTGDGMGYDYKSKGLCVVWDIFRQEYRVFGSEMITWHRKWPVSTPEEREAFQKYFYDYIINLSQEKRLAFMGYITMEQQASSTSSGPANNNIPSSPTAINRWKNVMSAITKYPKTIINRINKSVSDFANRAKSFLNRKKT